MRKVSTQVAFLILALFAQNTVSIFAYDERTGTGSGSGVVVEVPNFSHEFEIAKANSIAQHGNIRRDHVRRAGNNGKSASDNLRRGRNGSHHSFRTIRGTSNANGQATVTFPIFRKSDSDRRAGSHRSGKSHKNTNNNDEKIAEFKASNAKLNAALQTAQKDLADAQRETAELKAKNEALLRKLNEAENKLKFIAILEKKLQDAEKIIYELKAKAGTEDQTVIAWKSKFEFAASKIAEYEEIIRKLNSYIAELKDKTNDDSESKKKLAEAFAKIAELRKALEEANQRLRYFAALQHKYRLPSQEEKSRKEQSRKEHSRKQNNNEFRTISITPTVLTGKSRDGKTTVVVGEELAE